MASIDIVTFRFKVRLRGKRELARLGRALVTARKRAGDDKAMRRAIERVANAVGALIRVAEV